MHPVDEFASGTPEQKLAEGAAEKFDYGQVEGALRTDLLTAETVFARCAKKQMRDLLGEAELREESAGLPIPVWHASVSVTLPFDGKTLDHEKLGALALSLATAIVVPQPPEKRVMSAERLIMVGALNVKLFQVGADLYTFGLRQKWSIRG